MSAVSTVSRYASKCTRQKQTTIYYKAVAKVRVFLYLYTIDTIPLCESLSISQDFEALLLGSDPILP